MFFSNILEIMALKVQKLGMSQENKISSKSCISFAPQVGSS